MKCSFFLNECAKHRCYRVVAKVELFICCFWIVDCNTGIQPLTRRPAAQKLDPIQDNQGSHLSYFPVVSKSMLLRSLWKNLVRGLLIAYEEAKLRSLSTANLRSAATDWTRPLEKPPQPANIFSVLSFCLKASERFCRTVSGFRF